MNIKDQYNKIRHDPKAAIADIKAQITQKSPPVARKVVELILPAKQKVENMGIPLAAIGGLFLIMLLYFLFSNPHIDGSSPQSYQKSLAELIGDINDEQRREKVSMAISNLKALETFYRRFMIEGEEKQLKDGKLKKPNANNGKWVPSRIFLDIVDGYDADDFIERGRYDAQKLQTEIVAYEDNKPIQKINNSKQNIRMLNNEITKMERARDDINSLRKIKISNVNYIEDKYGITRLMYRIKNETSFNIKDIEFNFKVTSKDAQAGKAFINENIWIVFPRTLAIGDTRQGVLSMRTRFKEKWDDSYRKNKNIRTYFTAIAFTETGGHKITGSQEGVRLAQLRKELKDEKSRLEDLTKPKPSKTLVEFLSYNPEDSRLKN